MIWSGHKILVLIMLASRKTQASFAYLLTLQGLNCLHTQTMAADEDSDNMLGL